MSEPGADRLASLRAMVADDPDDPFSRYALAMQLKGLDQANDALEEFSDLVARQPGYVATYYQYGALLHTEGRSDEAVRIIERGVEVATQEGDDHACKELKELLEDVQA